MISHEQAVEELWKKSCAAVYERLRTDVARMQRRGVSESDIAYHVDSAISRLDGLKDKIAEIAIRAADEFNKEGIR